MCFKLAKAKLFKLCVYLTCKCCKAAIWDGATCTGDDVCML